MAGSRLRYKGVESSHSSNKRRRLSPPAEDDYEPARPPVKGKTRLDTYVFDDSLYDDDADLRPDAPAAREDDFQERLWDAMREDEGLDAVEGFYSAAPSSAHLPNRWRSDAASSYSKADPSGIVSTDRLVNASGVVLNTVVFKDAMDDDSYAEHIRAGMYRRTHADEIRRQEQAEKDKKEREARLKAERKAAQKAEVERLKREEREAKRYEAENAKTRRQTYDQAWARLISLPADKDLRSSDFIWPVGPGDPLDAKHVSLFLLGHLTADDDDKARRKSLRAPLLAYHPDRFSRLVERVPSAERDSVRKTGLQVSQLLNDVLASLGGR